MNQQVDLLFSLKASPTLFFDSKDTGTIITLGLRDDSLAMPPRCLEQELGQNLAAITLDSPLGKDYQLVGGVDQEWSLLWVLLPKPSQKGISNENLLAFCIEEYIKRDFHDFRVCWSVNEAALSLIEMHVRSPKGEIRTIVFSIQPVISRVAVASAVEY